METQLKCVLLLSLEEMALRRVVVVLWSGSDILASISKFRCDRCEIQESLKEWRGNVEDKVKDKVLKLELPEVLTKQMIDIARPIGLQIMKWRENHKYHLSNNIQETILPNSEKLCWTTAGLIEYRKTAEELVRCDALDVVQRYQIACKNCLEDYIPLLWKELPEETKEHFCNKKYIPRYLSFCWPHILKGELSTLDYLLRPCGRNLTTFNQYAFEDSAEKGNKTATEHFFQKLTHEEREASLIRTVEAVLRNRSGIKTIHPSCFKHEGLSDVFFYLLCVMTPEQQMEIFKARPIAVLWCFLDWPQQDLFLENAGHFWTFLTPSGYDSLLWEMADRFKNSDHYFPKLFPEFFKQSSPDFKKYFVDYECDTACHFLSIFFDLEDSESIEVIFRNVDAADTAKLVFNPDIFKLFFRGILWDRWHLVEACLRDLSKEDKKRLKEAFTGFLERSVSGGCVNRKFKRFFEFLD